MVQTLCYLLECLLTTEDVPADCPKETYELYFVFAAIWAFGGAMTQDQVRGCAEANTPIQSAVAKLTFQQRFERQDSSMSELTRNHQTSYPPFALLKASVPTEGPSG